MQSAKPTSIEHIKVSLAGIKETSIKIILTHSIFLASKTKWVSAHWEKGHITQLFSI